MIHIPEWTNQRLDLDYGKLIQINWVSFFMLAQFTWIHYSLSYVLVKQAPFSQMSSGLTNETWAEWISV